MQKRENRKKEIIKRKKQRLEKQKSILYKKKIREKNKRPYKQQALGQYVQKPSIVLRETEKPKDNKNVAGRSEENVTKSLEETDQKPSILGEFCEEDNKEHVQDKIADGNRKLDKKGSEKKQGEVRKEIRSTRAKKPEKQEYTLQIHFRIGISKLYCINLLRFTKITTRQSNYRSISKNCPARRKCSCHH